MESAPTVMEWGLPCGRRGRFYIGPYRWDRGKAPSGRGLPRKRVGERACDLVAVKLFVSPSVSFADSSLAEGAFE